MKLPNHIRAIAGALCIGFLSSNQIFASSDTKSDRKIVPIDATTSNYHKTTLSSVKPSLKSVIQSDDVSVEDVMASGQLGGILHPNLASESSFNWGNQEPSTKISSQSSQPKKSNQWSLNNQLSIAKQNREFAQAMDDWNKHDYKKAYSLMNTYLKENPNGIWAGEAELHMGCEARFNGRLPRSE